MKECRITTVQGGIGAGGRIRRRQLINEAGAPGAAKEGGPVEHAVRADGQAGRRGGWDPLRFNRGDRRSRQLPGGSRDGYGVFAHAQLGKATRRVRKHS